MTNLRPDLSEVPAFVLAGGLGTRLRSVVPDLPKVLATVRGRPFIHYVLDYLAEFGIRSVVLGTGYRADQVSDLLGDRYGGMSLSYSTESEPLGTGGALRLALPQLHGKHILALNGDSFCPADLVAMWQAHQERRAAGSVLLVRVDDARQFGGVQTAEDDRIVGFSEKDPNAGGGWINAGVYLLSRDLVASLPGGRPVSLEREGFPGWLESGLFGHRTDAPLLDIGTPESFASAEAFFEAH